MNASQIIYLLLLLITTLLSSVSNKTHVTLLYYNSEPIEVTALSFKTEQDIELLARIAQGEAIGEGLLGQQLVIECVLNRANSKHWPNTIEAVIKQRSQFNGYATNNYNKKVRSEIRELAYSLLLGKKSRSFPTTMYFFYNPDIATNKSFIKYIRGKYRTNRSGNHEYAY